MASARRTYYPDHLNPFGSDDEEQESKVQRHETVPVVKADDYPDHLSPFDDNTDQNVVSVAPHEDYDDSLNPFGDEDDAIEAQLNEVQLETIVCDDDTDLGQSNPFACEDDIEQHQEGTSDHVEPVETLDLPKPELLSRSTSPAQESLELPPVPLPRTKSLLKKEQAQRKRQQQPEPQQSQQPQSLDTSLHQDHSRLSVASSEHGPANTSTTSGIPKKKRNAPPVPINFKRQVSGSLDAIESELNDIGDELAAIEAKSIECQKVLKDKDSFDDRQFKQSKDGFIECIRRRNSIVKRQKELMYRKRELKLDQIHSDIEYELRMIGNKQVSHRTPEDECREKVLLKRLVEIVEEKSDIVENLNKETACVTQDISEALAKLNLTIESSEKLDKNDGISPSNVPIKNEDCDKKGITKGPKLSKIATLLPKGGTLKAKMRVKPKHLFKKCDLRSSDKPAKESEIRSAT